MGRFDGKVVLVTGGNRNTGLDIVEEVLWGPHGKSDFNA